MPRYFCCLCGTNKHTSEHHPFPKRIFGNGNGNPAVIILCRGEHDQIEAELQNMEKESGLTREELRQQPELYIEKHKQFLNGKFLSAIMIKGSRQFKSKSKSRKKRQRLSEEDLIGLYYNQAAQQ